MIVGIILIIVAVVLFLPAQMILPFPFGLGAALLLLILGIVGIIVSVKSHKKGEKHAETIQPKRKFCSKCGTKLSEDSMFCSKCGATQEPLKKDDE